MHLLLWLSVAAQQTTVSDGDNSNNHLFCSRFWRLPGFSRVILSHGLRQQLGLGASQSLLHPTKFAWLGSLRWLASSGNSLSSRCVHLAASGLWTPYMAVGGSPDDCPKINWQKLHGCFYPNLRNHSVLSAALFIEAVTKACPVSRGRGQILQTYVKTTLLTFTQPVPLFRVCHFIHPTSGFYRILWLP